VTLTADRQFVRPLVREHSPADAMAAYYALHHSELFTKLALHRDARSIADGFIAVCQTGFDLFQPFVVLRAPDTKVAAWLLRYALSSVRSYQVVVPPVLAPAVEAELNVRASASHRVLEARRADFRPVINVLVASSRGPEGSARFAIRAADETLVAESGINWRTDEFAEIFVQVEPAARGRGLGKSVVSACTAYLLEANLRPLYIVDEANAESLAIAESLGYTDTGARERAYVGSLSRKT
jgi:GNAT superfamily N-acetyltransferase